MKELVKHVRSPKFPVQDQPENFPSDETEMLDNVDRHFRKDAKRVRESPTRH